MTEKRKPDPEVVRRLLAGDGKHVVVHWPHLIEDEDGEPVGVEMETFGAVLVAKPEFLTGEEGDDDDR